MSSENSTCYTFKFKGTIYSVAKVYIPIEGITYGVNYNISIALI